MKQFKYYKTMFSSAYCCSQGHFHLKPEHEQVRWSNVWVKALPLHKVYQDRLHANKY